jgi:hypothetical protein
MVLECKLTITFPSLGSWVWGFKSTRNVLNQLSQITGNITKQKNVRDLLESSVRMVLNNITEQTCLRC